MIVHVQDDSALIVPNPGSVIWNLISFSFESMKDVVFHLWPIDVTIGAPLFLAGQKARDIVSRDSTFPRVV